MASQTPYGLGGPGSSSDFGGRVASKVSSGPPASPVLSDTFRVDVPTPNGQAGLSQDRTFARSTWKKKRRPRPELRNAEGVSPADRSPFVGFSRPIPSRQQDGMPGEAGFGCNPWVYGSDNRAFPWLPWTVFGSDVENKARNPDAGSAISYHMRPVSLFCTFLGRFFAFFALCFTISLFHRQLESMGLYCGADKARPQQPERDVNQVENSFARVWAETLVTTGACFLIAQGLYGLRAARDRMERVRQTAVTLAYSFIKTTAITKQSGHEKEEMQLLIYECLALLTAFPVALVEQIRENTCEPDITWYCQEVSRALAWLRGGHGANTAPRVYDGQPWDRKDAAHHEFATVEYFFEIFSLQLQLEFSRQTMRTKAPSMTSQHIMFNLRNHFENMVDVRNVDDRRTPIIRENIDMLSLAGRECTIYAKTDVIPVVFLYSVAFASWLIAVYSPIHRCAWFVDWAPEASSAIRLPTLATIGPMVLLSVASSMLTTVITEMWRMWDPFGKGTNTFGWTLGIAMEIDNMLNDFYVYDSDALVRGHVYMKPWPFWKGMGVDVGGSASEKAVTV